MSAKRRSLLAALAALAAGPRLASSQARFPERPITFLVPYGTGGSFDLTIRALATGMEPHLGQPVLVVNRPGASGSVMLGQLARAKPDGYTIGSLNVSINAAAPQMQESPFDPIADFTPIMNYGAFTLFVAVPADSPFPSLRALVESARVNPKSVTVGITGLGGVAHLMMSRLALQEKADITFVPFPGGAQVATAVLGGHVNCAIVSGEVLPHARAGRMRLLATFNDTRFAEFPAVPTTRDLGYGWAINPWMGVGGPRDLPVEPAERLREALFKAMETPGFRSVMGELAVITRRADGAELARLMRTSFDEHRDIARAMKIGRYAGG